MCCSPWGRGESDMAEQLRHRALCKLSHDNHFQMECKTEL